MIRFFIIWMLIASPAIAQEAVIGSGVFGGSGAAPPSYTGPQDIVGTAPVDFYGLRAVSSSFAASKGKLANLNRQSDSTTCDIDSATNGSMGLMDSGCASGAGQTVFQWAADATCTGTIASTTLTCTGATGTPHAGDTLSGTGINIPIIISSCGTFTGGAGTCTIASFLSIQSLPTISVGETITLTYKLLVNKFYDQGSAGLTLDTSTSILFPICYGTVPCIGFNGTDSHSYSTGGATAVAQPLTISAVIERITNTSAYNDYFNTGNGSLALLFANSPNLADIYAGTHVTATATDVQVHAIQNIFNGASSIINVDNTKTTVNPGSTGIITAQILNWGSYYNGSAFSLYQSGYGGEIGVWGSGFSTTIQTNMCHNQYTFYNSASGWTGASC